MICAMGAGDSLNAPLPGTKTVSPTTIGELSEARNVPRPRTLPSLARTTAPAEVMTTSSLPNRVATGLAWAAGSATRRNYAGTGKRIANLHLIYEDQTLLVINKPPGLLSVPLPSKPVASVSM